jgi:molybdopterin/thiamine biosynthesis adenylyltransferase
MSNFHSRQAYFCEVDKINNLDILIVGCGAIGRNVASNVARLGVKSVTLVDGDTVESHNIVPQNWAIKDCGKPKVEVLAAEISAQMEAVKVIPVPKMWTPNAVGRKTTYDAVWSTVDNIDVRKILYNYYRDKSKSFFDVRIGGPVGQILTVTDMEDTNDWYLKTIFPKSESASFGCVQPMANYIANIASGISVSQFINHFAGKKWPVHRMITYCAINGVISPENPDEYFGNL